MEISSPIKDIPDCWKDETRMNSLFAPFRKKEMNPVGWEAKMKFWHTLIEKWCLEKNEASFSVQLIQKEFKRNNKTPVCIATAIEELIRCGQVKTKSEFLAIDPSQGWTSWAVDSFVKTPINRSISLLWNYWHPPDSSVSPDTEFIHIPYLKEKGEKLLSETESSHEKLLSVEEIKDMLSKESSAVSEDTVHCIVHYLQLQGLALVETVRGAKLVKLLRQGKSESRKITQADLAVFQLEQNIIVLRKNVSLLELEKEKYVKEAKKYIAMGMDQSAKSSLRKKNQLEKCVTKRLIALDNLHSLLDSLRNTESDTKVLDAYRTGLEALKGVFGGSKLSEDGVFETMSQLQEMNEIQDEIQMAMSQSIEKDLGEIDLEKELADIMRSPEADSNRLPEAELDRLPKADNTGVPRLPDVPNINNFSNDDGIHEINNTLQNLPKVPRNDDLEFLHQAQKH